MHDRSFWEDCAEAMELTIEGNRLIVAEISDCIRDQFHAAKRWIGEALHSIGQARQFPPV